ncbi:MAG TPA: ferrochelatase [Chloroflexota bacterium]|nr:ferrochelatase [Chloroflexota bacterium]
MLLMAYGTPRTLEEVEPFYVNIRGGRQPAPELIANLRRRYEAVGGHTPLLEITTGQAEDLAAALGGQYRVFTGMKHWHPFIEEAVRQMAEAGIARAVALALAPHYSALSIGGYFAAIDEAQAKLGSAIAFERVKSWHLQPAYLAAVAEHTRQASQGFEPEVLVFTAHSLPRRILEQHDPYVDQLQETCRALAERLGGPRWQFAFQSAGATGDAWLGPDILQTIEALANDGVQRVLAAPVGFIADHLEILYDLDVQARQHARERGIELRRIASLNRDPGLIAALADAVHQGDQGRG